MMHLFADIGDHHHLIAGRRHDLFLQQGPTAALDQVQVTVEFIRPVNRQVEPFRLIERDHLDPHIPRQLRRARGGRHPFDPQPIVAHHLTQTAHQPRRRRSGAKPHAHPVFHEFARPFRGHEFGLVDR